MSQSQLARLVGVKQQTISYICSPESPASTSRYATQIAAALGVNPVWLQTGDGGQYNPTVSIEVSGVRTLVKRIPLLETEEVLPFLNGTHQETSKQGLEMMTDHNVSNKAFAIEIEGDSMKPKFKSGDRVVIEPDIRPEPGDFVAASIGGAITFRKYRERGEGGFELVPLNDDWPTVSSASDSDVRVVGVMIEHRSYRTLK
jgi:SOS-response transcriptional repressor LexA